MNNFEALIPAHFQFKFTESIADEIDKDQVPLQYMHQIAENYPQITPANYFSNIANLFTPNDGGFVKQLRRDIFDTTSMLSMHALDKTPNVDPQLRRAILCYMELVPRPPGLTTDEPDDIYATIEGFASSALALHTETQELQATILESYAKPTLTKQLGEYALCGFGFGIHTIDRAYNTWRDCKVADYVKESLTDEKILEFYESQRS